MKRTPIKRGKPPKRTRLRRKPRPNSYNTRERDTEFLLAVKQMPCIFDGTAWWCCGPTEADHAGRSALSRKCPDIATIPLCTDHHRDRHEFAGPFRGWDRAQMRAWLDEQIAATQPVVLARIRRANV